MSEINKIVDKLSNLTIIESVELVKKLEEVWGINHLSVNQNSENELKKEDVKKEKTHYNILLKSFGERKISIIKEVKMITGLSLIKAKEKVDSIPQIIKSNVPKKEAQEIEKKLKSLGASVELK